MKFDITFTQNSVSLQAFAVPDSDLKLSHGDCGVPVSYCGNPVTDFSVTNRDVMGYFNTYGTACE